MSQMQQGARLYYHLMLTFHKMMVKHSHGKVTFGKMWKKTYNSGSMNKDHAYVTLFFSYFNHC